MTGRCRAHTHTHTHRERQTSNERIISAIHFVHLAEIIITHRVQVSGDYCLYHTEPTVSTVR